MSNRQLLDDRQDVLDVVTRLGRWLDGEGGDPAAIYDVDVVVRSPRGQVRGLNGVLAVVTPAPGDVERTQHRVTDTLVEVHGDRATVHANQLVHFFRVGEAPYRTSGLRVHYELARRADGWRLVDAEMRLEWLEGEPVPASYEPDGGGGSGQQSAESGAGDA